MGNSWTQCCDLFRRGATRMQRGEGSKYFRSSNFGEHYTIEFENLVESDEAESPASSQRAIREDEVTYLRERRYTAIYDTQVLADGKLQAELAAEEELLRVQEEAEYAAQRQSARVARERVLAQQVRARGGDGSLSDRQRALSRGGDNESCVQSARTPSEVFRSSRVSSETNVATPNTESSYEFTSRTRSTNEDGTSLDLEWEDEEGMTRWAAVRERSRTEEDILRAALRPAGARVGSGPTSASEDSTALEWENDFVGALPEDAGDSAGDSEGDCFANLLLETPPGDDDSGSDRQDR